MKKLFAVAAAAMLMVGVASQAMAAFENGNFQLVAYEEADHNGIQVSTSGNEAHFDLGYDLPDLTTAVDTGITLADYDATSWDDVYVGIFGGGDLDMTTWTNREAYFSSVTDDFTASVNTFSQFKTASGRNSNLTETVQAKDGGSYYTTFLMTGDAPGTYAQLVNANADFGAEVQLVDGGAVTVDIYSWTQAGVLTEVATWSLDTSSGSLVVAAASEVPVPAAVWLMGSGLLGLVGLRRKNA